MNKVITLIKSSGVSRDEFRNYWKESWLPSLLAIPDARENLVRIDYNHVIPAQVRAGEALASDHWVGVAEFWFYDRPSTERFLSSKAVDQLFKSHSNVIAEVVHLHVYEFGGWDRGSQEFVMKMMAFIPPKLGTSRAECQDYWKDRHVQKTARLGMSQKLSKYYQNHTVAEHRITDFNYDFAGVAEMWFENMADAESIFSDEALLQELKLDEAKFSDPERAMMLMLEEETVYVTNQ